jgi:hypothetical protein
MAHQCRQDFGGVRACKRYYGLMRRSDELRPAWACSAYSGRSLPLRAVRLTFPSLPAIYGRACPGRGLPQPGSAMTTRPKHPLPRQVLHLQACQRPKAAHKNLLWGAPACTGRCAGEGELLFALIHCGPILPGLAEGVNRQVLPVFWRFCPIGNREGGRQRPSGQAMRGKHRDSGANRAGGGQCRAQARLQTGLENNGSYLGISASRGAS